jgi:predicted GH43/DUF377 family glycosyl hydrolase
VDYHRNTTNIVAARCFRSELKPKLPKDWQLDPYFDRYSGNTSHIAVAWDYINIIFEKPSDRGAGQIMVDVATQILIPSHDRTGTRMCAVLFLIYVSLFRRPPAIWIATSDNPQDWGGFTRVMTPRHDNWDCNRVGGGGVPIETKHDWLVM